MGDERYNMLKRIASVLVAIALWYLSIRFSVAGFSIKVPDLVWAGWVLGMAVTVIELIFTSENRGRNLTLTFLGVGAYVYGVWSNIIGINASRGVEGLSVGLIFGIVLGLILEIAPEPLFLWGILGGDTAEGDIVSTLGNIWSDARKRPVGRPKINRFPFMPDVDMKAKPKVDTVSNRPDYLSAQRLSVVSQLNKNGGRLILDKNISPSPVIHVQGLPPIIVSRSLIRQMVEDGVLKEHKRSAMITEWVLTGAEPPIKSIFL